MKKSNLNILLKHRKKISKGFGSYGRALNNNISEDYDNDNYEEDFDNDNEIEEFVIEIFNPVSSIADIMKKQLLFKQDVFDKMTLAANENNIEKKKSEFILLEQKSNLSEVEAETENSMLLGVVSTLGVFAVGLLAHFSGFLEWFIKDKPAPKTPSATPITITNNPTYTVDGNSPTSILRAPTYPFPMTSNKPATNFNNYGDAATVFQQKAKAVPVAMPFNRVNNSLTLKKDGFSMTGQSFNAMNNSRGAEVFASKGNTQKVSPKPPSFNSSTPLPSGDIVALGRALQSEGFRISEHNSFGGTTKVHGRNSAHYDQNAIDINIGRGNLEANNPEQSRRMDDIANRMRASGYTVLWKVKEHDHHVHAQLGSKGIKGAVKSSYANKSNPVSYNGSSNQESGGYEQEPKEQSDVFQSIIDGLKSLPNTDTTYQGTIEEITKRNALKIANIAQQRYNDLIEARTPKAPIVIIPQMQSIGSSNNGTVQTISENTDKKVIKQYIRYFDLENA